MSLVPLKVLSYDIITLLYKIVLHLIRNTKSALKRWKFCHLLTLKYFQTCMNFFVFPNTKEDILKKVCNQAVLGHHWLPWHFFSLLWKSMVPQYIPLCSAEQTHSYRFATTWGWVNADIFIFGWTIPLSSFNLPFSELYSFLIIIRW